MRILAVRRRDLVCQQVVEMVTAYVEEALSGSDRRRLEKHLAGCPHCTEYLAQIRETIRLAGRLAPEDLTPRMRADLTEVYRRWQAELSRQLVRAVAEGHEGTPERRAVHGAADGSHRLSGCRTSLSSGRPRSR